jgi:hypothetical protein
VNFFGLRGNWPANLLLLGSRLEKVDRHRVKDVINGVNQEEAGMEKTCQQ